jgi:hypothetical protein
MRVPNIPQTGGRLAGAVAAGMLLGSLAGLPALAQQAGPSSAGAAHQPMRERFAAANTTHDGHLTLAQAQAADLQAVVRNFDAIDAEHKGYVTLDDVRGFMKARRAARQAGGTAP